MLLLFCLFVWMVVCVFPIFKRDACVTKLSAKWCTDISCSRVHFLTDRNRTFMCVCNNISRLHKHVLIFSNLKSQRGHEKPRGTA